MCLQAMKTAANKETNKLLTFSKTTKTVCSSNKPQAQMYSFDFLKVKAVIKSATFDSFGERTTRSSAKTQTM